MSSPETSNSKRVVHFKVLGKAWKAHFWRHKTYVKKFERYGGSSGITLENKRELHFNLAYFNEEVVVHELMHAFSVERSITELQLSKPIQFEEFFCELVAKHLRELLQLAALLLAR